MSFHHPCFLFCCVAQELQSTLNKLKGSLNEMTKLNALLCEGASRERQGPLKGEMTDIDKRLDSVAHRLNAKLADLEMTIAKWNEYYKRLNNFCDWLNEKECKLNEVYENKQETPENQLKKSEVGNQCFLLCMMCDEDGYELLTYFTEAFRCFLSSHLL